MPPGVSKTAPIQRDHDFTGIMMKRAIYIESQIV